MDPAELERLVDRAVRRLPTPRAPSALLPRVIAATRARQRPWYARAWRTWPVAWQAASLVLLIGVVAGGLQLQPLLQVPSDLLAFVTEVRVSVADTTRGVDALATTFTVLWRALLAPVVPYLFLVVFAMCLACGLFGTALGHLAFGKAFR